MQSKHEAREEFKAERLKKIIAMIDDERSTAYIGRKLKVSGARIRQILKEHAKKQQQES